MTEQDLRKMGFKREDVLKEESGDRHDYHYYSYELHTGLTFISCANDETTEDGEWYVYISDVDDLYIYDIEGLEIFINVVQGWKKSQKSG